MMLLRQRRYSRAHPLLVSSSTRSRALSSAGHRHLRGHVLVTSVDSRAKSLAASERFHWLVDHDGDRRVLALTAGPPERSRLHRLVDERAAFYELERRGHGVFGAAQWCQQALEECGSAKRVLSRGRLAAFLTHHRTELPLERLERSLTSPLAMRRAVLDVLQLFQLLESEGVGPAAYANTAAESDDAKQMALAELYGSYQTLLDQHGVTTWDGAVLNVLEQLRTTGTASNLTSLSSIPSDFLDAMLHGYTDIVVDDLHSMSPATLQLVAALCAHPAVQSSTTFTRVLQEGDECERGALLRRTLRESHGINVETVALDAVHYSLAAAEIRVRAQQLLGPLSPSPTKKPKDQDEPQRVLPTTGAITCFAFDTVATEERAVGHLIKERLAQHPARKIAVLAPTYADAQRLAASLVKQGIRVQDHASNASTALHLFDEVRSRSCELPCIEGLLSGWR